ncbi:MAG: hypothetical protein DME69_14180 [Verrucomicrobia bacterium]|nr:MAG: hypothetical protein DME69_14180 [Verrucomicrobiota bacterium]
MENAASEDARPRATESIVSGVSGKFFKLFRNFGPPFPEKEMRDGPKIQTKFLLGPVTAARSATTTQTTRNK